MAFGPYAKYGTIIKQYRNAKIIYTPSEMVLSPMNTLFYGDNLAVLRRYVDDESVDLVYLDPPFQSDQNYNVLFAEQDGSRSAAQIGIQRYLALGPSSGGGISRRG